MLTFFKPQVVEGPRIRRPNCLYSGWISEQFQGFIRLFSGGFQYLWIRYSSECIQSI